MAIRWILQKSHIIKSLTPRSLRFFNVIGASGEGFVIPAPPHCHLYSPPLPTSSPHSSSPPVILRCLISPTLPQSPSRHPLTPPSPKRKRHRESDALGLTEACSSVGAPSGGAARWRADLRKNGEDSVQEAEGKPEPEAASPSLNPQVHGGSHRGHPRRRDLARPSPHEVSFLRLLEKISDDCTVEINETGTKLKYKPGILMGGKHHVHDCGVIRAIGYFLEPLIVLGLFGKKPLSIRLKVVAVIYDALCFCGFGYYWNSIPEPSRVRRGAVVAGMVWEEIGCRVIEAMVFADNQGITNDSRDPSVDTFRSATLPILKRFGVPSEGLELKIESRGAPPHGGGEVLLSVPIVKNSLTAVNWTEEGMVKRIRGVTFSTRVTSQFENTMIHAARGIFNRLLPDVHIFTDHKAGLQAGKSPGYGISLVAETTTGCFISVDTAVSYAQGGEEGAIEETEKKELMPPEEVGEQIASGLLGEIEQGGVVDSTHQGLLFLLCALCPPDVSSIRVGKLSPYGIETLRNIIDFLGVKFVFEPDQSTGTVKLTSQGCGLQNFSRKFS
ncbi:RNA cyclase family protein [Actinidia rufa]|uniref:RNA cyclase family protein n=1 Tax=Actinidia rufa TaxID=165716 RepID=A0A7J0E975_9ERIC|nr:RNA cyclase family protein [Actinidia rufa]